MVGEFRKTVNRRIFAFSIPCWKIIVKFIPAKKPYNLLHINAMYDLLQCIYMDAVLQKGRNADESGALTNMADRSDVKRALILADRGYESYSNFAHIQEKGWYFLIRVKDSTNGITSGLVLPDKEEYDIPFHINLTRKQTNGVKQLLKDKNHYKLISSRVNNKP